LCTAGNSKNIRSLNSSWVPSVSQLHRHMGGRMARVPRGRALAPAASGGKATCGAEFPLDPWYRREVLIQGVKEGTPPTV